LLLVTYYFLASGIIHPMFLKHRVEALSDGVFAIAMTLLILDLKVPMGNEGPLSAALARDSHGWVSFAVSFLLAGVFWMHQHRVFEAAAHWSKANLLLTFVFLGFISTLPFSTSLWGHHLRDPLALTIYFGNQFVLALVLVIQVLVTIAQKHVNADAPPVGELRLRLLGLTLGFGAAMIVAFYNVDYSGIVAIILIAAFRIVARRRYPKQHGEVRQHA
ncbi:MAG: TMEM175 family protein, partial [Terriglobales bacterium]